MLHCYCCICLQTVGMFSLYFKPKGANQTLRTALSQHETESFFTSVVYRHIYSLFVEIVIISLNIDWDYVTFFLKNKVIRTAIKTANTLHTVISPFLWWAHISRHELLIKPDKEVKKKKSLSFLAYHFCFSFVKEKKKSYITLQQNNKNTNSPKHSVKIK